MDELKLATDQRYVRDPNATVLSQGDQAVVLNRGWFHELKGIDANDLSRVLTRLGSPVSLQELTSNLQDHVVDQLLGVRLFMPDVEHSDAGTPLVSGRVVFGLTGGIGVVQVVEFLMQLRFRGVFEQLSVVQTSAAESFIPGRTLAQMGFDVWQDMAEIRQDVNVPHIELAESAELVVVMPASAHTIAKLAWAECSDLLSLICAATSAPIVVVPSMNYAMWSNTLISRNVEILRSAGMHIVEPAPGYEVSKSAGRTRRVGTSGITNIASLLNLLRYVLTAGQAVEGVSPS